MQKSRHNRRPQSEHDREMKELRALVKKVKVIKKAKGQ